MHAGHCFHHFDQFLNINLLLLLASPNWHVFPHHTLLCVLQIISQLQFKNDLKKTQILSTSASPYQQAKITN